MGRGGEADIAEAHRGKQTDRSLPYSHREQGFPPCSGTTGTFSWRIKEGAGTVPEKATELRFVSATQLLVAASWIAGQSLAFCFLSSGRCSNLFYPAPAGPMSTPHNSLWPR